MLFAEHCTSEVRRQIWKAGVFRNFSPKRQDHTKRFWWKKGCQTPFCHQNFEADAKHISNHRSVGAELTSVISTLLLLSGPSLLARVQHVKMFWSQSTIRNSHCVNIHSFSSMATEWAEKGQPDSSLHQEAETLHRPWWNTLPCGATTLAPLLGNLRVKISTLST